MISNSHEQVDPPAVPARDTGGPTSFSPLRAGCLLACLSVGYIGVYLCRKNLSVAIPMIQHDFGATKGQVGVIASWSTLAYVFGKVFFGPLIDRYGGRICFLFSLLGVAVFGALGALSGSIMMLAWFYSGNRLAGAAGWGSMVKQVPDWFPPRRLGMAMAFLSLSFVFGGLFALLFAGRVASLSGNAWRAVMGIPSVVLLVIVIICWRVLPRANPGYSRITKEVAPAFDWKKAMELTKIPQFWVVCGLSFTLTVTRETFNVWTVDFFKTEGGAKMTNEIAAFLSTPFDAAGAVGILFIGWAFDRLNHRDRSRVLVVMLFLLAVLIYELPALFHYGLWLVTIALGLIGFLSYGPYSLLAGIFAVEIRGKEFVGIVAGLIDACGYLAGVVSGYFFGRILDAGGYRLGFQCLAAITVFASLLCVFLSKKKPEAKNDEANQHTPDQVRR